MVAPKVRTILESKRHVESSNSLAVCSAFCPHSDTFALAGGEGRRVKSKGIRDVFVNASPLVRLAGTRCALDSSGKYNIQVFYKKTLIGILHVRG